MSTRPSPEAIKATQEAAAKRSATGAAKQASLEGMSEDFILRGQEAEAVQAYNEWMKSYIPGMVKPMPTKVALGYLYLDIRKNLPLIPIPNDLVNKGRALGTTILGTTLKFKVPHGYSQWGVNPVFLRRIDVAPKTTTWGASAVVSAGKILGTPTKSIMELTIAPIQTALDIVGGKPIDKALKDHAKNVAKNAKTLAPYVQMVVSVVPGIGQGASAMISAGIALAEGQPITQVILAGVKGAIPGGIVAQSAFSITEAVISGKPIDKIAIAALPITETQKDQLEVGLQAAKDLANGKPVGTVVLDNVKAQLSTELRTAIDIGIAVGEGQNIQKIVEQKVVPIVVDELSKEGSEIIKNSSVYKAGEDIIKQTEDVRKGFQTGVATVNKTMNSTEFNAIRAILTPNEKKGFDLAVSTNIGAVQKKAPSSMPPREQFGYYTSLGLTNASTAQKVELLKIVAKDNSARQGAREAVKTWWDKILDFLEIGSKKSEFGQEYPSILWHEDTWWIRLIDIPYDPWWKWSDMWYDNPSSAMKKSKIKDRLYRWNGKNWENFA